ncbi:MAG TPA: permease prefix domain 1-containing protein [Jiangellaceae bacterium]
MAGHALIAAYVSDLARRLPADTVAELADGLEETFEHYRRLGTSPAAAAAAAVAEFGRPEQVASEFTRQSPGRRAALALLATGPLFAVLWGTSLASAQAWTWQIPIGVALAFGAALVGVAAVLVAVVLSRSYARTRLAGPACGILVLLDAAMLATVALVAPVLTWPMAMAIPASCARIVLSVRSVPRILAG